MDKDGRSVATSSEQAGVLKVADVKLWWPYLMHESPGYLYSLEVGPAGSSHKPLPLLSVSFGGLKRQKWSQNLWFHATGSGSRCERFGSSS